MPNENYVIAGAWTDQEWMQAASTRNTGMATEADGLAFASGPRTHPYGILAHTVVVDGQPRVYPSRDAAITDGVETALTLPPEHIPAEDE